MEDIYKAIWSRWGKRPWTYITRDSYHSQPLIWIICLLAAGAFFGRFFGLLEFGRFLTYFLIGVLAGHFWWGTKWHPGEKGK